MPKLIIVEKESGLALAQKRVDKKPKKGEVLKINVGDKSVSVKITNVVPSFTVYGKIISKDNPLEKDE